MTKFTFLLDEHMKPFAGLPIDLFGFGIMTLKEFDPSFVNRATPDWILLLAAAERGLTGVITNDLSQLSQENEVRALEVTGISVITYRKGVNDELTKWGLLMAYSPLILRHLDQGHRGALILPTPGSVDHRPTGSLLRVIEERKDVGSGELKRRADKEMKSELSARGLNKLWPGR